MSSPVLRLAPLLHHATTSPELTVCTPTKSPLPSPDPAPSPAPWLGSQRQQSFFPRPELTLTTLNFYERHVKLPPRGVHVYNAGFAIMEWANVDLRMARVCKGWAAEMELYLSRQWRLLSKTAQNFIYDVTHSNPGTHKSFVLFQLLHKALSKKLDREVCALINAQFKNSLSLNRFQTMVQAVNLRIATLTFWNSLSVQYPALELPRLHTVALVQSYMTLEDSRTFNQITRLEISSEDLEVVPEQLFSLVGLKHLDLTENELKEIPEGIVKLQNLVTLKLSGNPITHANLASLQALLSQIPTLQVVEFKDDENFKFAPVKASSGCGCVIL
jgi:hypothetical protein